MSRERPDRAAFDEAQKAKLIFIAIAVVVTFLLVVSFVRGNRIRTQLDAARQEVQSLKSENIKLSRYLETRTEEMERYRRSYEDCRTKLRYTKPSAKKATRKKRSNRKKTRR